MMPFTASAALISFDSNQSSSRSVTLMVKRRVTSATPRTSRPRIFQAVLSAARRSPGFFEPRRGGMAISMGPSTWAMPWSHASHFGSVSASFFEMREIVS
jgi:hypothetical protein